MLVNLLLLILLHRSLKDLPQGYAGQTISAEKFQNDYMAPLTSDSNHNTVVFLQDKVIISTLYMMMNTSTTVLPGFK